MASGRGVDIIYGPGELYINPSDVSGTSGTGLGYTEDGVMLRPRHKVARLRADEKGVEQLKQIKAGADWAVGANLLQWNSSTIAQLFPGMAVTGGMAYRQSEVLGTSFTEVKLLWVPEDTTNVPCVYFRKAIGKIEESAAVRFVLGQNPRPTTFPVIFENMSANDANNDDTVQIRTLANIALD